VDRAMESQRMESKRYWCDVLHRVVSDVRFLCERGLALRGSDEKIASKQNGNFLGCMEVLAEFDPFLSQHIEKFGK